MKQVFYILKRELSLVSTNKALVLVLLIAPILYAFMYGSIYLYKTEEKVALAVVDMDGSELSRTIATQVDATMMADVVYASDLQSAREMMNDGTVQGYLFFEKGLEQQVLSLQKSTITLVVNGARFLPASDLTATVTKIALTLSTGVRLKYISSKGSGNEAALKQANPIILDYRPLFNESSSYGAFLLPGLLAIILQQTLFIGLVAGMGIENETRFKGLSGHNSASSILFGKTAFYVILFLITGLFFVLINFSVLSIPMRGSGLHLLLLTTIFLSTLVPMGLLIGSFFKTSLLGMQVMAFSSYPMFLITGYSMPLQSLPKMVQLISALLPTTPFLKAYQSITQAGGNLYDNRLSLIHLLLLCILYGSLFLVRISYLKKKRMIAL